MAIHVKELVIRANVGMEQSEKPRSGATEGTQAVNAAALLKQAVAEVMRITKDKKNR